MKRCISTLLLAALCASIFSCAGEEISNADTTNGINEESTTEADLFEGMDVKDYGGRTFNWLIPDMAEYSGDMWVEESVGEVYNDAVYERNQLVQDRFNIKINPIIEEYTWSLREQYLGKIRASVQSNDKAYDLIACQSYILPTLILDGLLLNLNEIDSLRFNESHWSSLIYESLCYNDKIFYMSGNISVNSMEFANVLFMNLNLLEDYQLTAPYELVKSGKWTTDVLETMIKDTSRDLDGSSTMDGHDQWGYIYHDASTLNSIPISFGLSLTKKEGNTIALDLNNEKLIDTAQYINQFFGDNPDTHMATADTGGSGVEIFTDGRALFYAHQLSTSLKFRDMEDDFAILPFPKAEETQKNYYSLIRDSFVGFCIPADNADPDFVGTITEALCVAGDEMVIPAYYDVVLKDKVSRDENSHEMLDIIKESLAMDFAYAYGISLDNISNLFSHKTFFAGVDYVSYVASIQSKADIQLEELLSHWK